MAKYLQPTTGDSSASLIAFGEACQTLIPLKSDFSDQLSKVWTKPAGLHGNARRIDSALKAAAKTFDLANTKRISLEEKGKLVVLMTAGIQSQKNPDALSSAAELLQKKNAKVVIIAIGSGVDFQELVHVIDRPHDLFPLFAFHDLTESNAKKIAEEILDTAGNVFVCVLKV